MTTPSTTPSPQPLDYGKAPKRQRRILIRTALLTALAMLGLFATKAAPGIWRQAQILYYQRQCMNYTAPADQVVYEEEPTAAAKLLAKGPEYVTYYLHGSQRTVGGPVSKAAAHLPACWTRFVSVQPAGAPIGPGYLQPAVIFLHRRLSRSGNRRLVYIRYLPESSTFTATFIEGFNYDLLAIIPATIADAARPQPQGYSWSIPLRSPRIPPNVCVYAGQPDLNDSSHFTIRYQMWGQEDVLDGYLKDDDTVTLKARIPPKEP